MGAAAAAADIDLRQPEGRGRRRDADVAHRREHAAGAERRAVDRRDHRDRAVTHRTEGAAHDLGALGILFGLRGQEFLEIETGAERARARAGEDRAIDVGARADRVERSAICAVERQGQRIDRRPVDGDGDDLARGFDDEFAHS